MSFLFFFFFNDTATTEIYTLSLHDALPISEQVEPRVIAGQLRRRLGRRDVHDDHRVEPRSEEHTSELQSRPHLVCRLLLEKKKKRGKERNDTCTNLHRELCCIVDPASDPVI